MTRTAARLTVLLASVVMLASCGEDSNDYNYKKKESVDLSTDVRQTKGPVEAQTNLEFPALSQSGSVVVVHKAELNYKTKEYGVNYSIEWDINKRTSHWSCYKLYSTVNYSSTGGNNVSRYYVQGGGQLSATSQYPNDQDIDEQYRFTVDPYVGSGFDHGHICPSADRLRSTAANYQTFFLTNMQPQYRNFNGSNQDVAERSPWFRLESRTRTWGSQYDTLYVCKGGWIGSSPKYIGSGANRIPVPDYFFVALLGKKGAKYKAIGFWMKHESSYPSQAPLSNYAVNINELERKTGLDFFCNLSDDIENEVESVDGTTMLSDWNVQ